MAGGYGHVTDEDGSLLGGKMILDMLDSPGDVVECIEQLYGMIWCLAYDLAASKVDFDPSPQQIDDEIERARDNHKDGIDMGGRVGQE
jgi:hypothetical protein